MRRRLQFFLIRQFLQLREQFLILLASMRRSIQVFSVLLEGAQIRSVLFAIFGVISCSTLGYMVIFGWNILDALFMTMITISSVGYGETRALTQEGRVFTIFVIIFALTIGAYGVSSAIEYVASGEFTRSIARRQRGKMILELTNHFIIAGFGRVGQEVAQGLSQEEVQFIIVEPAQDAIEKAQSSGYLVIEGNATEDEILLEAGIERARGIICATSGDATNVYVVLTARGLNENLFIISRASDENSEGKLIRAGADRVISPYILSGRRMANLAARPFVVDFLDITGSAGELEKTLEEIVIEDGSIICNRTLGEVDLRQRTGALILGLYRSTGGLITSPQADTLLEPGSRMIVLGTRDELDVAEALAGNFLNMSEE